LNGNRFDFYTSSSGLLGLVLYLCGEFMVGSFLGSGESFHDEMGKEN
jgi:hypothetical protein